MPKKKSDKKEIDNVEETKTSSSESELRKDTIGSEEDKTATTGVGSETVDSKTDSSTKEVERVFNDETGGKLDGPDKGSIYRKCLDWCNAQEWARSRPIDVMAEAMTKELLVYPSKVKNYPGLSIK